MLAVVSPMLYDALILGKPFIWLAPVAACLAEVWAAANIALVRRPGWFIPGVLIGIVLTGLLAWAHPYVSPEFEYPLGPHPVRGLPLGTPPAARDRDGAGSPGLVRVSPEFGPGDYLCICRLAGRLLGVLRGCDGDGTADGGRG